MVAKTLNHILVVKNPVWLLKTQMILMESLQKQEKIVKKIKKEIPLINLKLKLKSPCIKMDLFVKMVLLESTKLKRIKNLWKLLIRVMFQKN